MTERMKIAVEATESLDPSVQDQLAERMLDFIDNQQWHILVRDPQSDTAFDALVEQDDIAQAAGDAGTSLDVLFEEWDRHRGIHR